MFRKLIAGAFALATLAMTQGAQAALLGETVKGCWGHFPSFGCQGPGDPSLNAFNADFSGTRTMATVSGAIEFMRTIDIWTLSVDLGDDSVELTIANGGSSEATFFVDNIVVLSELTWDGGGTIGGVTRTGGDLDIPIVLFENNNATLGNVITFGLPPLGGQGNGTFGAGESRSATYRIEHLPEPGTLALFGLGLAGLGAAARRQTRTAV